MSSQPFHVNVILEIVETFLNAIFSPVNFKDFLAFGVGIREDAEETAAICGTVYFFIIAFVAECPALSEVNYEVIAVLLGIFFS